MATKRAQAKRHTAESKASGRARKPTKRLTKKFRLDAKRAKVVERIAKREDRSESEVLREGIDLLERVRARRKHVPQLLDFAKGGEPPKVRFRLL